MKIHPNVVQRISNKYFPSTNVVWRLENVKAKHIHGCSSSCFMFMVLIYGVWFSHNIGYGVFWDEILTIDEYKKMIFPFFSFFFGQLSSLFLVPCLFLFVLGLSPFIGLSKVIGWWMLVNTLHIF